MFEKQVDGLVPLK